jgi:general secretion pathway protein D
VGEDGVTVSGGGLRVVPLDRLGAVALLARDGATLDRAYGLVRQLDRPREANATRLFIYRVQNRSAEALATSLSQLFGQQAGEDASLGFEADAPRIVVDGERNALVISAPSRRFQQLVDLIRQLDAAPVQVLVEATILEVALNDALRYGVQFAFESGELFDDRRAGAVLSSSASPLIAANLPGFAFSIGTAIAPDVIIDALDDVSDLRVVSSPKLLVRDNQSATLQIGDQVPIVTQSSVGTADDSRIVNAVEYRDTGVTLTVTPRVNAGGFVSLDVLQEVSSVAETTTSGIDSPTISRRAITTNVTVRSGQTVVLGGLIQDRSLIGRSGVPVAVDVPVIGPLFGRRNQSDSRSELLALLRPHILSAPAQAADLTERLRRDFDAIAAGSGRRPDIRRPGRTTLPTFE